MALPTSTLIGVLGQSWTAEVTDRGAVRRPGGPGRTSDPVSGLDWFVAADDRWHDPAVETTVRQRRVDGTPVVETRLRIPNGDAVQTVWAVPDRGGTVVVEFTNESPLPIAVAVAGGPFATSRPPADVPVRGIRVPEGTILLPVGHHASVRVTLGGEVGSGPDPARLPGHQAVIRGWTVTLDSGSRLELPDPRLAEEVRAARADLLLGGPVDASVDPVGHLLDLAEAVRLGEPVDRSMPFVAHAAERVGRSPDRLADRALAGAHRAALLAEDPRAAGDLERLRDRRRRRVQADETAVSFATLGRGDSSGRFVADVEMLLVRGGELLPNGIPTAWIGSNFEAHGLPTSPAGTVGFALRWHGDRPAVLWEQDGAPVRLTAPALDPDWSASTARGEALWPAPRGRSPLSVRVDG